MQPQTIYVTSLCPRLLIWKRRTERIAECLPLTPRQSSVERQRLILSDREYYFLVKKGVQGKCQQTCMKNSIEPWFRSGTAMGDKLYRTFLCGQNVLQVTSCFICLGFEVLRWSPVKSVT